MAHRIALLLPLAAGLTAPGYGVARPKTGLDAIAFPSLFSWVRALSAKLPELGEGAGFAIDGGPAGLPLTPPTVEGTPGDDGGEPG